MKYFNLVILALLFWSCQSPPDRSKTEVNKSQLGSEYDPEAKLKELWNRA